jgi:hypothetical protein
MYRYEVLWAGETEIGVRVSGRWRQCKILILSL